ncbi:MAG: CehA/McbA family metallohydrolase, partial [archaeon]|nr:CehA/McbA family metallohydrolase [archaeon]
ESSGVKFVAGDGTNRYDTPYISIPAGQWFHFAAVVDKTANILNIYINGTRNASIAIPNSLNISNSWNLSIGNDEGQALLGSTWQYPVMGQMDEVAIWNGALNSTEILALYQKGNSTNSSATSGTNASDFYSGTYTSEAKDAGEVVAWGNMNWSEEAPYGEELLNYQQNGAVTTGGLNMAGNVFLGHLNEASGNIGDYSGRGNNGTQSGGVTYGAAGKFGNALSFDGSNDYVDLGNDASLRITANITLMSWVKFNQIPSGTTVYALINKNEAGGYGIIANEQLANGYNRLVTYFYIGGSYRNAGVNLSALSAGAWYHVAATYNGTTVAFFLNGNMTEALAATGSIGDVASYGVALGANPGPSYAEYFNGAMDEVAIFNRSLTADEISNAYKRGMNLKFQARTSNDGNIWSNYRGISGEGSYYTSPGQALNLPNSRYVQYKAFFERNSTNYNVKLYNASLNYSTLGDGVTVTLDSPADSVVTNEYNINITCSASSLAGLANITPYYNKFDWGPAGAAQEISGTSNTTTFTLSEIASTVKWNCYACDSDSNCTFAGANRTIIIDTTAPEISLTSPANGYFENNTRTPGFVFSSIDNRAATVSCTLMINNSAGTVIVGGSNSSVNGETNITPSSLSNGNYTWWVNCSDSLNNAESEKRNIAVNITNSGAPTWAKANTHMHTTASDGTSTLAQVVSNYSNAGYNVILITDHNVVTNCAGYTNLSDNFLCINSEEWTPGSGAIKHVVRANVSAHVATGTSTDAEVQNAINTAMNEGGFAIAAHPNWSSTIWSTDSLIAFQNYSIMEVYNGVIERLSPSPYAVTKWDVVLKSGKKMFGIASDDMHIISTDFNKGWSKVYMEEFTKEAYMDSMENGYFYASNGPTMDVNPFTLYCDGTARYHMGQTANCSEITVNATATGTNSTFRIVNISLVKDGNRIYNKTDCSSASTSCTFQYSENVSNSGYYRMEAMDNNSKQLWSNPVWVNKIVPRINITVNEPANNSVISSHIQTTNITLSPIADTLWIKHGTENRTLCTNCSGYYSYSGPMKEGVQTMYIYANNSNNDVTTAVIDYTIDFNRTYIETFVNNKTIEEITNAVWSAGKISLDAENLTGSLIIRPVQTIFNLTSIYAEWTENNTLNAKGEGQLNPVRLFYKFANETVWGEFDNGTSVTGLNNKNFTIKIEFDKNNETAIDLLGFKITWTEFTTPLISGVGASSISSSSATISWTTDIASNSTVLYGTTSGLGSSASINDSATSHLVMLSGLGSSTSYFYRVMSCVASSCAYGPQEQYTPYSFTTQAASNNNNNGGGGGGGGGGGSSGLVPRNATKVLEKLAELEITPIGKIVVNPGESKKLSLILRNAGTTYLNECKLKGAGKYAGWISAIGVKELNIGQRVEIIFDVNAPKDAKTGEYL